MNTILGLALLGVFIIVAVWLGQLLITLFLGLLMIPLAGIKWVWEKLKRWNTP